MLVIALLCLAVGGGLARPEAKLEDLPETKDTEAAATSVQNILSELRDSTVVPLLLNPFLITKLTCGSLITFYDTGDTEATVAVDLCLTALLVAKLMVILPIVMGDLDVSRMQGGVLGILDRLGEGIAAAKLDFASRVTETGPEGEPFEKKQGEAAMEKLHDSENFGFQYQESDSYFGFGFDGWQSGAQDFPNFQDMGNSNEMGFVKRGFSVGKLEKLLSSTLHNLEKAVSIETL